MNTVVERKQTYRRMLIMMGLIVINVLLIINTTPPGLLRNLHIFVVIFGGLSLLTGLLYLKQLEKIDVINGKIKNLEKEVRDG